MQTLLIMDKLYRSRDNSIPIYFNYVRIVNLKNSRKNYMENQTTLEILSDKVSQVLQAYHSLKGENEMMRNELITLKAEREIKDQEIEKLSDQNAMKDLEIEEIVNKIESILG